MSNVTGQSSSSSNSRQRRSVHGIPKRCWCGVSTISLISRSQANPNRRYYRCSIAASQKLSDDNHVFKWFDDAIKEEIESMGEVIEKLRNDVNEIRVEFLENQKLVPEKIEEYGRNMKIACGIAVLSSIVVLARLMS